MRRDRGAAVRVVRVAAGRGRRVASAAGGRGPGRRRRLRRRVVGLLRRRPGGRVGRGAVGVGGRAAGSAAAGSAAAGPAGTAGHLRGVGVLEGARGAAAAGGGEALLLQASVGRTFAGGGGGGKEGKMRRKAAPEKGGGGGSTHLILRVRGQRTAIVVAGPRIRARAVARWWWSRRRVARVVGAAPLVRHGQGLAVGAVDGRVHGAAAVGARGGGVGRAGAAGVAQVRVGGVGRHEGVRLRRHGREDALLVEAQAVGAAAVGRRVEAVAADLPGGPRAPRVSRQAWAGKGWK